MSFNGSDIFGSGWYDESTGKLKVLAKYIRRFEKVLAVFKK